MELVKKNVINIICGVIALLALVAWLWPVRSGYETFQKELDARAAKANEIDRLMKEPRTLPIFTPGGKASPLTRFPSPKAIKDAREITDTVHRQAEEILAKAIEINRAGHDLLRPGSLPRPDTNAIFDFRREYNAAIKPGGKLSPRDPNNKAAGPFNLADQILQSAVPPTDVEIQAAKARLWNENYAPKIVLVNQQPVNQKEVVNEFLADTKDFDVKFRHDRATQFKIYLDPTALSYAQNMDPTHTPSPEDIWYAQLSLWIQQDVCYAIAAMNKSSRSIPQSPIKHLVQLNLDPGFGMYVTGAVPGLDAVSYAKSPTGRVCNTLYDVVHFRIVAVVDAQSVKPFIEMLEFGKFVTVMGMDIENVDLAASADEGYDYGRRPVVELSLRCEALYLRDWTARGPAAPMPAEVKAKLGVVASDQPAPPANPVAAREE